MREIKFRGFSKKYNQWVYDWLVKSRGGYYILQDYNKAGYDDRWETAEWIKVDPETVGQFTGLKDKNGKEIYEGDIVKYKLVRGFSCEDDDYKEQGTKNIRKVEFVNGQFFPRETYYHCDDGYYAWRMHSFEVIGNIYENPELLK